MKSREPGWRNERTLERDRKRIDFSVAKELHCTSYLSVKNAHRRLEWKETKNARKERETARFYCYIESKRINSISEITKLKGEEVDLTLNHTTLLISCRFLDKCNWLMLTHWTTATKSSTVLGRVSIHTKGGAVNGLNKLVLFIPLSGLTVHSFETKGFLIRPPSGQFVFWISFKWLLHFLLILLWESLLCLFPLMPSSLFLVNGSGFSPLWKWTANELRDFPPLHSLIHCVECIKVYLSASVGKLTQIHSHSHPSDYWEGGTSQEEWRWRREWEIPLQLTKKDFRFSLWMEQCHERKRISNFNFIFSLQRESNTDNNEDCWELMQTISSLLSHFSYIE